MPDLFPKIRKNLRGFPKIPQQNPYSHKISSIFIQSCHKFTKEITSNSRPCWPIFYVGWQNIYEFPCLLTGFGELLWLCRHNKTTLIFFLRNDIVISAIAPNPQLRIHFEPLMKNKQTLLNNSNNIISFLPVFHRTVSFATIHILYIQCFEYHLFIAQQSSDKELRLRCFLLSTHKLTVKI